MQTALSLLKKTLLASTLLAAGLAGTSQMAPTTHAATAPHITAYAASATQIGVTGSGFTPGGPVAIYVHNSLGRLVGTAGATASLERCHGLVCIPGGFFHATVYVNGGARLDHVIARDVDSATWSNRVNL